MLVASLGTPYEIRTAGTILFLEDVAAKPYQIDRMLMQLKLAGKLADVRGIIFGEMLDCTQTPMHKARLYAGRSRDARSRRPGGAGGLRLALRPRFAPQHHSAVRRARGAECRRAVESALKYWKQRLQRPFPQGLRDERISSVSTVSSVVIDVRSEHEL